MAMRETLSDEVDKVMYALQPKSEIVGCNLINSVLTF